jgi:hypothetical protein
MEINADPLRQTPPDDNLRITIEEAVRDFLADEKARQLAKTTTCQGIVAISIKTSPAECDIWRGNLSVASVRALLLLMSEEFRKTGRPIPALVKKDD